MVLADTALDADTIRRACAQRHGTGIVPLHPERVLEVAKPRPKVWSFVAERKAEDFSPVRLPAGQGRFVAPRRIARCRLGPKVKTPTFSVHRERRGLHSLGEVQRVFSTTVQADEGVGVTVQKIRVRNDHKRTVADWVERSTLRWQRELFVKELKSTRGLHR